MAIEIGNSVRGGIISCVVALCTSLIMAHPAWAEFDAPIAKANAASSRVAEKSSVADGEANEASDDIGKDKTIIVNGRRLPQAEAPKWAICSVFGASTSRTAARPTSTRGVSEPELNGMR